MRAKARDLRENTGLMRDKGAKRRMFEKRRRFCRALKIMGGPEGCLARDLLINASHRDHRGLREFYPRMARIIADYHFFDTDWR